MERVILSGCLLFLVVPASPRDTGTTPIDPGVETKTGCDSVKRADKLPRPGQNSPTLALTTITGRTQVSISSIHNRYPTISSIATWRSYRSNGPLRGLRANLPLPLTAPLFLEPMAIPFPAGEAVTTIPW